MDRFITCNRCNTRLPFTEFRNPTRRKRCNECVRAEARAYYNRHKEAILARIRQERNSDDYRAARREQYQRKQVCYS
jgi:hypothetical protein